MSSSLTNLLQVNIVISMQGVSTDAQADADAHIHSHAATAPDTYALVTQTV